VSDGVNVIASLVDERSVLVCCGSGGVGKTTTSAALALAAAERGRRACVVTIDPARRLADALGEVGVADEPHRVEGPWPGELYAVMLDAKGTFDRLVRQNARDAEQAERILGNRLYRNLVGALSGTQEYMATEKLFELHEEADFDLVVVDTPPTHNALDFLDAPRRLTGFLDNRLFRLLLTPGKAYLRALSVATQVLLRTIARVAGSEIVDDTVAFFQAFEGMESGFRERAARVERLLAEQATAFVLVSAPRRDSIEEATFLAAKLASSHHDLDALVVNRVQPYFGEPVVPAGGLDEAGRGAGRGDDARRPWDELVANLAELDALARRESDLIDELATKVAPAPVVRVPALTVDVHDLEGLHLVVRHLLGGELPLPRDDGGDR